MRRAYLSMLALLLASGVRADLLVQYSPDLADSGLAGCDGVVVPCQLDSRPLPPDEIALLIQANELFQSQPTETATSLFTPGGWPVPVAGPFDPERYLSFTLTPDAGVGALLDRLTYPSASFFNANDMGSELSMRLRTSLDGFQSDVAIAAPPGDNSAPYELEFDLSDLPRPLVEPIELRLYPANDGDASDFMNLRGIPNGVAGLRLFGSTTITGPAFAVTRLDDPVPDGCEAGDCSLREAAIASAESSEPSFIILPEGKIELSIPGDEEGPDGLLPEFGDIDLVGRELVTVLGAGQSETVVDANGVGRVFQTRFARFLDLTIAGGVSRGGGAGISSRGDGHQLTLVNVAVRENRADAFGGGVAYVGNDQAFEVVVETPPSIAGAYAAGAANFGPSLTSGVAEGVLAAGLDMEAVPEDACSELSTASTAEVSGAIALVDRGTCSFVVKVYNAQLAGALGVIIVNNEASDTPPVLGADPSFEFLDDIVIPTVSVTMETGALLRANLGSDPELRLQASATMAGMVGLRVERSIFERNNARNASALFCSGNLTCTVRESEFVNNETGFQAAVSFLDGVRFAMDSTTIAGTVSGSWPGGMLATRSSGSITNTTLSGNEAGGDGIGGAMAFLGANVDLRHLTITGNRSTAISGIASFQGSNVSIGASLVDDDCGMEPGGLVSAGGNLATGTTCGLALSSDRQGVPPAAVALQPLAENGGETSTHAIDLGSAAIGHVPSAPINLCESTDQRNTGRVPFRCDAGAFQSMPTCGPGGFIGDNAETLTSVIDRAGEAGEISNVDVYLDIFHETISDLVIELVHRKSGITRTLVNRPLSVEPPFDDCAGNSLRTVLSDSAEDLVDESCNDDGVTFPRTRYRPPQALSAFAGLSMDTNWELRVTDIVGGDAGVLLEWCVLAREGGLFADGFE